LTKREKHDILSSEMKKTMNTYNAEREKHARGIQRESEMRPRQGFYTIKEAACYLRVSDKSVRRAIGRGLLRPSKAFRKLLIPAIQLEKDFYNKTN
jgi:excisionase family DNA binding protein